MHGQVAETGASRELGEVQQLRAEGWQWDWHPCKAALVMECCCLEWNADRRGWL